MVYRRVLWGDLCSVNLHDSAGCAGGLHQDSALGRSPSLKVDIVAPPSGVSVSLRVDLLVSLQVHVH